MLGSSLLFGRAAIDSLDIDVKSIDEHHRLFRFNTPNFRMVTNGLGQPAFVQIGDERYIKHGTVHIIRVRQVRSTSGTRQRRGPGITVLLSRVDVYTPL